MKTRQGLRVRKRGLDILAIFPIAAVLSNRLRRSDMKTYSSTRCVSGLHREHRCLLELQSCWRALPFRDAHRAGASKHRPRRWYHFDPTTLNAPGSVTAKLAKSRPRSLKTRRHWSTQRHAATSTSAGNS